MRPEKYSAAAHLAEDGSVFIVLAASASSETRARRVSGTVLLETWTRTETVTVSPEAIAGLHNLAEGNDGQ